MRSVKRAGCILHGLAVSHARLHRQAVSGERGGLAVENLGQMEGPSNDFHRAGASVGSFALGIVLIRNAGQIMRLRQVYLALVLKGLQHFTLAISQVPVTRQKAGFAVSLTTTLHRML